MKYIIFKGFGGRPHPILFPDKITHEEMREQIPYTDVLSAGYVRHTPEGFSCYGESKELDTSSRPEDSAILFKAFNPDEISLLDRR